MKPILLSAVVLLGLLAVPPASAYGFCDAFDPPMSGPQCYVADQTLGLVDDVVTYVDNIVGFVYDIAWGATEGARCIVIKALGGSC